MEPIEALRDSLSLAVDEAQRQAAIDAERALGKAIQTGQSGNGRLPLTLIEAASPAAETMLRRIVVHTDTLVRRFPLFESEARWLVENAITGFYERLPVTLQLRRTQAMNSQPVTAMVSAEVNRLENSALRRARHHLAGLPLDVPDRPEANSNTINLNNSTAVIQQGGNANQQNLSVTVDWGRVSELAGRLDYELMRAEVSADLREAVLPDLETIKAQLRKASPSETIVREAAKSLRNVTEGAIGSALVAAPLIAPIVARIISATGLG